ncbi:unnamed protein product [Linum trigynum]|uniref:Uncharacterized protein n=1 Tax=Linum trigynum TaxID=586398 RepID=A0AAV2EDV4_9ROSI
MTFNFPCRRGNYTRHLDKVLEEAAAEFYPGVKFMRVSGFCSIYDTPKHNTKLRPSVIAVRECSNRQVLLSTRGLDLLLTP